MGNTFAAILVTASLAAPAIAHAAVPAVADRTDGPSSRFIAVADTSGIDLDHVWARPTIGAGTSGAVYFTVTDNGAPDQLVGVSTPVAAAAAVHETIDDHGVMKMRPVPSLALEPGTPVTLRPGGYHVMLTGLKGPLKAGDSFPMTLTFAHAQPVTVTAKVEAMSGAAMSGPTMNHGAMQGMPGMR